jgi:tetratricopeptide (TPR) repeat protein
MIPDEALSEEDVKATTLPLPAAPNAPSNLTATATSTTEVQLSWIDNSNNETGFEVFRSTNTKRDWGTARALYQTTLARQPDNLLALAGLAEIAQQQGQFDGALAWWQQALDQADLPVLHGRLAQLFSLRAEYELSLAEWQKATELAPNVARYYVGLGDACLLSGLEACAQEAYATSAVVRSLPDQTARILVEANLWQQQGRFDRAIPLYEAAAARQPTQFNHYILESAYRESGQAEQAEALLQDLRSNSPFSSELIRVNANLLTTVNRVDEAAKLYRRAIWLELLQAEETIETRQALAQLLLSAGLLPYLQAKFPTFREPPCYMTGSNEIAELLCTIQPRFNRLLFYSGDVPHSGSITAPELLTTNVRKGRLTMNVYASVLPKAAGRALSPLG